MTLPLLDDPNRVELGCATLGGMNIGTEPTLDRAIALVEAALELGVRRFDVAPLYGNLSAEILLGQALDAGLPEFAVVLGDGEAALAAAAAVVRGGVVLVRVGAGHREGPHADTARAIDHLAAVRLVHAAAALRILEAEDLAARGEDVGARDDPETGTRIVRALSRARGMRTRGGR